MMRIEANRLLLCPYSMDDLDFFASLWADPVVVRYIGEGVTRQREEAGERLERIIAGYESGYGLLAAWHKKNSNWSAKQDWFSKRWIRAKSSLDTG